MTTRYLYAIVAPLLVTSASLAQNSAASDIIQIRPTASVPYPSLPVEDFIAMNERHQGEPPCDSTAAYPLYDEIVRHTMHCNWYCGGCPLSITTSSRRQDREQQYDAEMAHDFDLRTSWVTGGKGESLTYTFTGKSPRITKVKIVNGMAQSQQLWQAHGRVKRLRVHHNGQPLADLILPDTLDQQIFEIPTVGPNAPNAPDWTLSFEILDIHPGTTHEGAAITELNFDGIDIH